MSNTIKDKVSTKAVRIIGKAPDKKYIFVTGFIPKNA